MAGSKRCRLFYIGIHDCQPVGPFVNCHLFSYDATIFFLLSLLPFLVPPSPLSSSRVVVIFNPFNICSLLLTASPSPRLHFSSTTKLKTHCKRRQRPAPPIRDPLCLSLNQAQPSFSFIQTAVTVPTTTIARAPGRRRYFLRLPFIERTTVARPRQPIRRTHTSNSTNNAVA